MSALAEFALAEIGDAELAFDSRWYADVVASASPSFAAAAAGGRVAYASASASLGVSEHDHVSRVVTQPALADASFAATAAGQLLANLAPLQTWSWTPAADGSRALLSGGTASLSFTADAVPVSDEIFGVASWAWTSTAAGQAFAHGVGAASLSFSAVPSMQSISNAAGLASLSWSGASSGGAAQMRAGYAGFGFGSQAQAQSWRWLDAGASWSFAAIGVLQARRSAAGAATMGWAQQGRLDAKAFLLSQATAEAQFLTGAGGGMVAGINAFAPVGFSAIARINTVQSSQGLASLLFETIGKPGGALFTNLPRAREGFVVPAAQEAWRVAPDPELEDV